MDRMLQNRGGGAKTAGERQADESETEPAHAHIRWFGKRRKRSPLRYAVTGFLLYILRGP